MTFKELKELFIFICLATMVVTLLTCAGHCSVSTKRSNAFGAVTYTNNPYTYLAGSVESAFDIEDEKALVVRIQPISTYMLFSSDILLCGYPLNMFVDKSNPVILVYETQAHRLVEGIGCHNLVSVREVKPEKEAQP